VKRVEELISGLTSLTETIKNGWQTSILVEERKKEEKKWFCLKGVKEIKGPLRDLNRLRTNPNTTFLNDDNYLVLKELSCVSDIFLIYTPKTKLQFSLSRGNYTTNKSSGFRSNLEDDG
jgi:hypothetical protein